MIWWYCIIMHSFRAIAMLLLPFLILSEYFDKYKNHLFKILWCYEIASMIGLSVFRTQEEYYVSYTNDEKQGCLLEWIYTI